MRHKHQHDEQNPSLLAIDQYMRWLRRTPRLSGEQEAQLIERVERGKREQQSRCPDTRILDDAKQARDQLVEGFQGLVVHIATQSVRHCTNMELLDLVQEGNLGLLHAIDHNRVARGEALSPLAATCIRQAIWEVVSARDKQLTLPERMRKLLSRVHHMASQLRVQLQREPSSAEIAAALGVTLEKVTEVLTAEERLHARSLQDVLVEGQAEDKYHFVSVFADQEEADVVRQVSLEQALYEAIETTLPQKQQRILRLRYGIEGQEMKGLPKTETARKLRMNRRNVQLQEEAALAHLKVVIPVLYGTEQTENEQVS